MAELHALREALGSGEIVVTTGIVFQELLQGFTGPRAFDDLVTRFADIPFISPSRATHIEAAKLRNHCRRNGVQTGTVDALIAQLCIENELTLLTTDGDFKHIARFSELQVWKA